MKKNNNDEGTPVPVYGEGAPKHWGMIPLMMEGDPWKGPDCGGVSLGLWETCNETLKRVCPPPEDKKAGRLPAAYAPPALLGRKRGPSAPLYEEIPSGEFYKVAPPGALEESSSSEEEEEEDETPLASEGEIETPLASEGEKEGDRAVPPKKLCFFLNRKNHNLVLNWGELPFPLLKKWGEKK